MAPTLAFRSPDLHLVPPPSQDFKAMQQVPNVFVIPPEEEQDFNPPFMYFDASQAATSSLCTSPDLEALDVALSFCQQTDNRAPSFHRSFTNESQETIVMPRRASLMKLTNMDLEVEDGQTDIRSRGGVRKYGEEIVEVVKVRRNEGVADVGEGRKMKKSTTFRARATQALRSIKLNVGKSNQRRASVSVPQERERELAREREREQSELQPAATLPSRQFYQEELLASPRPTSPSMSRRRSVTLGALFTTFSNRDNASSRPASPAEELMSPTSPTLVSSDSSSSVLPSRPMSPTDTISSHTRRLQAAPSLDDIGATPTKSPTLTPPSLDPEEAAKPTLSKRKSFRRRLSVLELQNLFKIGGSSSTPSDVAPPSDPADDLFSPSRSRPKSMDAVGILSASSSRSSNATRSSSFSDLTARPSVSAVDLSLVNEDAELEMRLDSLHFDSLHIDPDEILNGLDLAE
ncbi:hypothetical protein L226DRAFT_566383 [Lentinus tigrinus ALCF2SS1-7]|uniref:Uncharacterized protein n=1 Tax=Lentinus tigrinus ALCF2SS1-6 TaxID=1328759 RepID=A0A5C2SQF8_9APHY|nr:hypothetical protein L227DRAFT_606047 [Lentinus tigrinus ALCF2SS1-6]RPD79815.1 hypothetical protein L226DRAFT_566383 [Lentinus tigrinus ALCF2SS1-7]